MLARVVGLFSGRGYNIESLTVAEVGACRAPVAHHHRDVGHAGRDRADRPQLERLVPVHKVTDLTLQGGASSASWRMIKVAGNGDDREEALRLADAFRARVDRRHDRKLRVRADRRGRQDRPVRRADAADRPRRGVAHRRRRDLARPAADVACAFDRERFDKRAAAPTRPSAIN